MLGWLKRFGKDERGNVMFITAAAVFPLMLLSFGALDVADGVSVRSEMQRATDAAVLAAANKHRSGSRKQWRYARNYFKANLKDKKRYNSLRTRLTRRVKRGKYVLEYKVEAKVQKLFAGFSEEELHTVKVTSSAEIDIIGKSGARLIDPDKYKRFEN